MAHTTEEENTGHNVGEVDKDDIENALVEEKEEFVVDDDDYDDDDYYDGEDDDYELACIIEEEYEYVTEDSGDNDEANHETATKKEKLDGGDADENKKEKVEENSRSTNRLKNMAKENSKQKSRLKNMENFASEDEVKKLPKENASSSKELTPMKVSSKDETMLQMKKRASGGKGVPRSLRRLNSSKKGEMGMIFMCNSETKNDCYRYNVLGLPASKRELVENMRRGMVLFLYDVDLKLMYGIYKAVGRGGYNIEPKAFKSQFPSQVRLRVMYDCKPLAEEHFRKAIQKNYYTRTKFDCKLNFEQVKDLCKLFTAAGGRPRVKQSGRNIKAESNNIVQNNRIRKRGVDHRHHEHNHGYESHHLPRRTRPAKRDREIGSYRRRPLAATEDVSFRHHQREDSWDDSYEQDMLLDRHDCYRREPVLESRDTYRRSEMMDRDDFRPLDFSPRWDGGIRRHRSYYRYSPYHESPTYRHESPRYLEFPEYHESSRYQESPAYRESPRYREFPEYREFSKYHEPQAYSEFPRYRETSAYREFPAYRESPRYCESSRYRESPGYRYDQRYRR